MMPPRFNLPTGCDESDIEGVPDEKETSDADESDEPRDVEIE